MDENRMSVYLEILEMAILNIRSLCAENNMTSCDHEASHVHNIPSFVRVYDPRRERYYWEVERVSYMEYGDPERVRCFGRLWAKLVSEEKGSGVIGFSIIRGDGSQTTTARR
ncbi:MAG: hypothetical protein HYX68_11755 [Planctomycetes bacterium]|nr:hypothetical protein [Planctomycetota bacterium]